MEESYKEISRKRNKIWHLKDVESASALLEMNKILKEHNNLENADKEIKVAEQNLQKTIYVAKSYKNKATDEEIQKAIETGKEKQRKEMKGWFE